MFNLKNQEANTPYGNLSADDILANIRKRLGISEEVSHGQDAKKQFPQQHNQQSHSVHQQVVNIHQSQSKNQQNLKQESPSNIPSFDDDFSLNMDFSSPEEVENKNGSNVNKAYRAYQNAMKSSYQQEIENSDNQEELNEDFDSELGEWNPEETAQESAQQSESFADQEELNEDFDSELDEWNPEDDDYAQSDQNNQQESNLHFLNTTNDNSIPSYGFGQIALNIETMFSKIVHDQVQDWCNKNLESLCRNIIKEELYKEKVESQKK